MENKVNVIAFYLPQFHVIPENDEWWGKGFTEWTNVKKAKPLYKNHDQPRIPFKENYYSLDDTEVMKWQAQIAKEHGVDGFCYYHYWFNGKKLLHKPLENMLKNESVDIPFCFSWANEPWARTWDGRDTDVLMPQIYGQEKEWIEHFEYLLDFFKDKRYIKVDNKPLMVIYRVSNIPDVDKMIALWNKLSIQNGFKGIHIVETLNSREKEVFSQESLGALEFEPAYTLHHKYALKYRIKDWIHRKIFKLHIKSYESTYKCLLERPKVIPDTKERYMGAFVSWDNSPRKGKKALIIEGSTPEKFEYYLTKVLENAKNKKASFLFINAWNEWAEGTYLEPDEKNGLSYLKALKKATK